MTWRELYDAVSSLAQAFRADGLTAGDRVAAYMPNVPETVIAMLAAASIGCVFTSASPDFGVQGVLDRFGQGFAQGPDQPPTPIITTARSSPASTSCPPLPPACRPWNGS